MVLFNTRVDSSERARLKLERDAALLVETGLLPAAKTPAALGRIRRTTVLAEAAVDQDLVLESERPLRQGGGRGAAQRKG